MNKRMVLMTLFLITTLLIIVSVNAEENCTEDIYECTEWSECSTEGIQTRTCELISICPGADNDWPLELMECEYVSELSASLECRNEPTLKQRIECRLNLEKNPPQGLEIAYMPEECTASFDEEGKKACIKRYSAVQKCWSNDFRNTDSCLRQQLNMNNFMQRKNQCNDADCLFELNSDVNNLAKLRIHSLIYRAELMLDKTLADKDSVIDIIAYMEQQKLALQNSPTAGDRIRVLENVKDRWDDFIDELEGSR